MVVATTYLLLFLIKTDNGSGGTIDLGNQKLLFSEEKECLASAESMRAINKERFPKTGVLPYEILANCMPIKGEVK